MITIKKISDLKYKIDKNPFYVDGKGGQLGDRATIADAKIIEVYEDYIVLDRNLADGKYEYEIDVERRKDISKQHTAQHIFSALAYNKFSLNTVGFRMAEEYTTVDLDSKDITEEMMGMLEEEVNQIISKNIGVEELIFSNEEAHKLENLRKQVKDKIKGDVRFIKISDIDICACAGFHVKKTSEIKIFKIIAHEIVKGNWTRFYFLAGDRARKDYSQKHKIIKNLTNIFSCKTDEILDMLDKNLKEKEKIEGNFKNLLNKYSVYLVKELEENHIEYRGQKIILYTEDKNIAEILGRYVNLDEFLLICGYDKNYSFISNKVNCQNLIKNISKNNQEIKGGGSPKKGNIKLSKNYSYREILEIIKRGIDEEGNEDG